VKAKDEIVAEHERYPSDFMVEKRKARTLCPGLPSKVAMLVA
jgi:hypothetical protein